MKLVCRQANTLIQVWMEGQAEGQKDRQLHGKKDRKKDTYLDKEKLSLIKAFFVLMVYMIQKES